MTHAPTPAPGVATSDGDASRRYRLIIRPGPGFALVVPTRLLKKLLTRLVVASFVGTSVAVFYGGGWIFQRWAPNLDAVAMTCLTTWTWIYHLLEILRRRQPLGRGVARAIAFTGLMAVVVIAGSALVSVTASH